MLYHYVKNVTYNCHSRNSEEHTKHAEHSSAYHDGEYNPQRLKSCTVTKNFGTKEKTVKLLDDKYHNRKEYNLLREAAKAFISNHLITVIKMLHSTFKKRKKVYGKQLQIG